MSSSATVDAVVRPSAAASCTAEELSCQAAALFADAPLWRRLLMRWRPYICPFETLMEFIPAGGRILDVGCGGGLFLGLLAARRQIREGVGFDCSAAAVDTARRMAQRLEKEGASTRLSFVAQSIESDWPEGPFDAVSVVDVAHHLPRVAVSELIGRAALRLAPGGRLIYKDMAAAPRWMALANRLHDLVLSRQWARYVPIERIEALAADSRLRLAHAAELRRHCYAHELRVFEKPAD